MNKTELIAVIAEKTQLSKADSEKAVNAFMSAVIETVAADKVNKVQLIGFGTFEARERKERDGKKPGTGEVIHIPASVVPAFKAGKGFKDAVAANNKPVKAAKPAARTRKATGRKK